MASRHYMRAWRRTAGFTLTEMAAAMNKRRGYQLILQPHLSRIETGAREYNQGILETFAEVIGCTPGDLLDRPPPITSGWRNKRSKVK